MIKLYVTALQSVHNVGDLVTDRLHRDERGQTAAEYLGILVVIALIIGAVSQADVIGEMGQKVTSVIEEIFGGGRQK